MSEPKEYGEVAYEAYREFVGNRGFHNEELPEWMAQSDKLREAWNYSAQAVWEALAADASEPEPTQKKGSKK